MDQSPRNHQRTRSRSFSLRSDKSNGNKESHGPSAHDQAEKARRDSFLRGESKANPNAAMQEAQPQALNVLEQSTLQPLRGQQFKDATGTVIQDPDRSNPTRNRLERPLDTIRSFQDDIDRDYKRQSINRASTYDATGYDPENNFATRRSLVFNSHEGNGRGSHYGSPAYYGNRASYYDPYGSSPVARPRQRYGGRSQSDFAGYNGGNRQSYYGGQQQGYPQPNDTPLTNGSDSTGPFGNSTGPSSENSSLDRFQGAMKPTPPPDAMNAYGGNYDTFGADAIAEENNVADDFGMPTRGQQARSGAPPVPAHSSPTTRKTIQLGGTNGQSPGGWQNQGAQAPVSARAPPSPEKKSGSWFKRRFSKNY